MKKQTLLTALAIVFALTFPGVVQAGGAMNNNPDGIAQYQKCKKQKKSMEKKTRYRQMPSETTIGNPAHEKMGHGMDGMKQTHENSARYNQ